MNQDQLETAKNQTNPFEFGRKIIRETVLDVDQGVLVIAPSSPAGKKAAEDVKACLEKFKCPSFTFFDPDPAVLLTEKRPVILIGNLADNPCVKYMYYKLLCIVDKGYPGKDGYTVRTLADPFATGNNVIHIGYSDDTGLSSGVKAFVEKASSILPYYNEVYCINSPYDPLYIENVKKAPLPAKIELIPSIHTSFWWMGGFVAYITGDNDCLDTYFEGWRKIAELSEKDPAIIGSTHLYFTQHVEIWRLLEVAGLIPDDLRGMIERCVFRWAESREGKLYAKSHGGNGLPSHNHTMFCGVSLMYASDFFMKYYKELEQPREWGDIARYVFESFDQGGWKPYCDDSSYSNQVTLPLVCDYAIFQDERTFLNTSGKIASDWLKAIIGQNCIVPSFGDGTVKSPFPAMVTRLMSHYYEDGELRWLHDCMYKPGEYPLSMLSWRLFDSVVKPVRPSEPNKINCFPLDRLFYDIWDKDVATGVRMAVTHPEGPYEQCFDKASLRTGWDEIEDDFLLIDGLGSNGVHAYNDAMGILDYTSKGIVWLVEENCYRWPEPEHCSILTISKSGYASDVPGYALVEEQKQISPTHLYLRMRLKNYNHCDWVREIHMIKGLCVLFHDTVIPNEEGDYVVQARFKTPSKAWLEESCMKSLRKNQTGDEYELRLSGYCSKDLSVSLEEIPYGQILFTYGGMHDEKFMFNHFTETVMVGKKVWERRYHEKDIFVSAMVSQFSEKLQKGEKVSFTHLVHPSKPEDGHIELRSTQEGITLNNGGTEILCSLAHPSKIKSKNTGLYEQKEDRIESPKEVFTFDSNITGIYPYQKGESICTLQGGKLAILSSSRGNKEVMLGDEIRAVDVISEENMILIGYGHDKLLAMDMNGNRIWETKTVRIPTLYDSWEYEYPYVEKLAHFSDHGKPVILAGCGDNQLRWYDLKGKLLNAVYVYATVPDIIEFADIDQDGEAEILTAGAKTESSGVIRVYKKNGEPGRNILVGMWLSTINAHALAKEDDKVLMLCGMNYAKNLKLLSVKKESITTVFEKNLGGTVQSVCFSEDRSAIFAGTSKGSVLAFDQVGNHLGHYGMNDSIVKLFTKGEKLMVIGKKGNVMVLDRTLQIEKQWILKDVSCVGKMDSTVFLASGCNLIQLNL